MMRMLMSRLMLDADIYADEHADEHDEHDEHNDNGDGFDNGLS